MDGRIKRFIIYALVLTGLYAGVVISAQADETRIDKVNDPFFGEALFHFYQQKYFSSINNLLTAKQIHPIKKQGQDPELLLGGLFLSYGLKSDAETIFDSLTKQQTASSTRDRAWFYLAKLRYQEGNYSEALKLQNRIGQQLPEHYLAEKQHMQANIYLYLKQYKQAAEVLQSTPGDAVWESYALYNLGIAEINQGNLETGIAELIKVGQIESDNDEILALRDKANTALGYAYLRHKQAQKAAEVFRKVRLHGPSAHKALLGIGWSFNMREQHRQSLTYWDELGNRFRTDSAVQESLLAVPFGLEQLDAKHNALSRYNMAIDVFSKELANIDKTIAFIKQKDFLRSLKPATLNDETGISRNKKLLPKSMATPYMLDLIASHGFQVSLHNYHDLLYMQYVLSNWSQQFSAYELMLNERKQAYQRKLPAIKNSPYLKRLDVISRESKKLAEQIIQINKTQNPLLLASEDEQELLDELDSIKARLKRIGNKSDIETEVQKHKLLYGIVYWNIATDFKPRLWSATHTKHELDDALSKAYASKRSLDNAAKLGPKGFAGFDKKIDQQKRNLAALKQRLQNVLLQQENKIQGEAIAALQSRRHQIENYHIRASYSLTRLYDSIAKSKAGK